MANNVDITAGSGTPIATDDVAGVHYQRIKITDGTEDSTTAVNIGGGVEANALRVTLANDSTGVLSIDDNGGSITIDGAVDTELPTAAALADNTANPTVPAVGSFLMGYDGTNWDRIRADGGSVFIQDGGNSITVDGTLTVNPQGYFTTVSTDVTRPADTTAYAVNDALSDSTSAPTSGGFTFTSAARASGGSGIITDAMICTSADAGTLLQGEIFLFNTSVTNINDNAAFAISDTEAKTCIGKIPFTLEDIGNNGWYHAQNLNIGFTCSGSANLRFLIRVKNAYTPASAEVLTFMLKILQVT